MSAKGRGNAGGGPVGRSVPAMDYAQAGNEKPGVELGELNLLLLEVALRERPFVFARCFC